VGCSDVFRARDRTVGTLCIHRTQTDRTWGILAAALLLLHDAQ
jgi:hypothetical protein